jgi:hypothetical protein
VLIAYFRYDDKNNAVEVRRPKYRDTAGNEHRRTLHRLRSALYNDLQMFVPYSALNMESGGEYDLVLSGAL